MTNHTDLERICRDLGQTEGVQLIVHAATENTGFSERLLVLVESIASSTEGKINVVQGDGAGLPALPALTLSSAKRSNIHYLALPEGHEAAPFVETVIRLAETDCGSEGEWSMQVRGLQQPVELVVFIGSTCPHCPQAARSALDLALESDRITTVIIDVARFPKLAEEYAVRSVPLTLIDRQLSVVGVVASAKLAEMIMARNGEDYDTRVFASLVEQGRLDPAAERLRADPTLLLTPWKQSTTSTRMGLMLVVEDVLDGDQSALDSIVSGLVKNLGSNDGALRGDTADLLGQIGNKAAIPGLRALKNDPNPDVAEIAEEALEAIEARG